VGCLSGVISCISAKREKGDRLAELEQLEKEAGDRLNSLEKLLNQKQRDLSELDQLTSEELERLSQEKQQQIENLNRQVEELTQLLDEQLIEIDQREATSRKQLEEEIEQYRAEVEGQLEAKRQQLEAIAQDDEQWLAAETEKLTQALEQDKAIFLEKHSIECDRLYDEIDLMKSELAAAYRLLEKYEEPEMPRGFDIEKVVAYKLQKFWRDKGIITHLISAYPDEANRRVLVRLRPKTGGQKQFKKDWLNELQIQEDLPEPPGIQTVGGAIEFEIKPRTWTAFKPWDDTPGTGSRQPTPDFENPSPISQEELKHFQAPLFRLEPKGAIKRIEQIWVLTLWLEGITQTVLLATVYRSRTGNPVAKGDGASYINARERLYQILDLQQIEYTRRGA
jgi:hypothetical protein